MNKIFKINIVANYVSQFYATIIAIVMVPLYIRYMGAEAYGLVGFFSMLQMFFQLLDVGLTPTMARESARCRGGCVDVFYLRRLLRAIEIIFTVLALLGAMIIIISAHWIASSWLNVEHLSISEVTNSVKIMALLVALRWICGPYRGIITGFERFTYLSSFSIIISTLRFVFVLPVLVFFGPSPTCFFSYQLIVGFFELLLLLLYVYRLLSVPALKSDLIVQDDLFEPLYGVLKFLLTIAVTGSLWVFVTQADKLILSKMLLLTDYAYFTLAVLVASGVSVVTGPISSVLLPRLSCLEARGDSDGVVLLYRNFTQVITVIAFSTSFILLGFSQDVLLAWTGNPLIAKNASDLLSCYALGNAVLALNSFPYYLQYSKGDLKLHLLGSVGFVVVLIVFVVVFTRVYGMIGAGYAWLLSNLLFFFLWVPVVHSRFLDVPHSRWLIFDVFESLLASLFAVICIYVVNGLCATSVGRVFILFKLCIFGLIVLLLSALGSPFLRRSIACRCSGRVSNYRCWKNVSAGEGGND